MCEARRAGAATLGDAGTASAAGLTVFCGLLLSISAFSCDITLPAFWSIEHDLGASIAWVQAIVPVFLFAAAFGQIAFGPISDRCGRKPVIVAGLALYLTGCLIAMLAPNIGTLQAGRITQGLGSACSVAVARAVLRDVSQGTALARAMALAMAIFALGPITAPLIGYGLVALAGWRAVFLGMAAFAAALLALATAWFRETNVRPDPKPLSPERLLAATRRIVRERQSRYFLLLAALTQFIIVSFVANAPRFFMSAFGIGGLAFAALFAATGLGIVLGQIVNRRLIAVFGVLAATRLAAWILVLISGLILLLALAEALSGPLLACLMFILNASFLVLIANAASLVIDPHREFAGFASAVFGAVTQIVSSLLALLTLSAFAGSLLSWAATIFGVTASVFVALLRYRPSP